MVIQVICAFTCKVGLNWAFQKFLVNFKRVTGHGHGSTMRVTGYRNM